MREYGFSLTRIPPYKDKINMSLYGRKWVSEKPYSRVFHAMHITDNNIDPTFNTFPAVIETFLAARL